MNMPERDTNRHQFMEEKNKEAEKVLENFFNSFESIHQEVLDFFQNNEEAYQKVFAGVPKFEKILKKLEKFLEKKEKKEHKKKLGGGGNQQRVRKYLKSEKSVSACSDSAEKLSFLL